MSRDACYFVLTPGGCHLPHGIWQTVFYAFTRRLQLANPTDAVHSTGLLSFFISRIMSASNMIPLFTRGPTAKTKPPTEN